MIENIDKVLGETLSIIEKAGDRVMSFYGKKYEIKKKDNDSPVTKADLESNRILIDGLKKFGWPILSEEDQGGEDRFGADLVWVIDPLDGTKDFIQETGEFTIMVALVEKQRDDKYEPILGVIYRPVAQVFYLAVKGSGAFSKHDDHDPKSLHVSGETSWHNMKMLTSRNHTTDLEWDIAKKLAIPKIETFGSSLKVCLIAEEEGHVNFNVAPFTWEWDVCASDIILSEAGGKLTDSLGEKIFYNKKNPKNTKGYVATNGLIHDEIIKKIKECSN